MLKKILIADDSESIRKYLAQVLGELSSAELTFAKDGLEALELVDSGFQPDLALIDINMPRLDGVQLLRCLSERKKSFPIVIISGLSRHLISSIEKLSRHYQLNLLGTIGKPIDVSALGRILGRLENDGKVQAKVPQMRTYEILRAIDDGGLEPWFQPQIDLSKRELVGLEVLCRLRDKKKGIVPADQFIETMERSDLIKQVTLELVRDALKKVSMLSTQVNEFTTSFNFSAKMFDDEAFVSEFINVINDSPVPNELIIVEITETSMASRPLKELEGASRIAIAGCGLSIDDFGCGSATFDRLHSLPFTELKIDKKYLPTGNMREADRALLESTINMARRLGMQVVVEGVESYAQWEMVQHLGCERAQGFFISAAMPYSGVSAWIDGWRART